MEITYQKSVMETKVKFIFGLAVLVLLVNVSILKDQQVLGYQITVAILATIAGIIVDYILLTKFFKLFELKRQECSSVDCAVKFVFRRALRWPLLFRALSIELITLYYAFFAKLEKQEKTNEETSFSYSKLSNSKDMFWIIAIAQLPTLPLIHVVVEHYKGPTIAWVITLLTLWSVIWYLAQVQAVRFRPIELGNACLKYRFGLSWKSDIPLKQISKVRKINFSDKLDGFAYFLSPLGAEKNIIIEFYKPVCFVGPFFLRKRKKKAAITIDRPDKFLDQLSLKGVQVG